MQVTVNLDDDLVDDARRLTGIEDITLLLQKALTALVQREAGRRLAELGGSDPSAKAPPRRRPDTDFTHPDEEDPA